MAVSDPSPGYVLAPDPPPLGETSVERAAGLLALTAMTLVWTWWALSDGAFFEVVLFPGSIILYLTLAIMLGFAPLRVRGGGPHEVTFLALVSLTLWTVVSFAWTPARDLALEDAQRTLMAASAFALGLWAANLLGRRVALAVAPVAIACGIVTVTVAVGAISAASATSLLDSEGTLDFPFGYRNATAAFLLISLFIGAAILARPLGPRPLRVGAGAIAAMAGSLCLLSQSRGSILGLLIGLTAFVVVSPDRTRALLAFAAALIPAALTAPAMLEPFDAAGAGGDVVGALNTAGVFALLAGIGGGLLAFGLSHLEDRLPAPPPSAPRIRRALLAIGGAVLVAAPIALLATGTDPIDWIDEKLESSESYGDGPEGSRFTFTGGLARSNFWSVAFEGFTDSPLAGDGAGGYKARYLRDGTSDERPRDAHSVPLEILGELGLPGLLLFLAAVGGATLGAVQSRRLGPEAAFVSTVALTTGAIWLGQGLVDWFWSFGAMVGPVFALMGAAAAAQALTLRNAGSPAKRRWGVVACLLVAATLAPLYVSERLSDDAARNWRSDPAGAYSALDRAASLHPLSDVALLRKAEIARLRGDDEIALDALERARAREPKEYRNYLIAAQVLADEDPQAALAEIGRALELNPRYEQLLDLERKLERRAG